MTNELYAGRTNELALADSLNNMLAQHELYLDVCRKLLDDSDYAIIQGTKHRKRTGWAKLRRAFNVSVHVLEEQYIDHGDVWGYAFTVEAQLPNGRTETGDGACFLDEFERGRIRGTHHNVRAKALTRAKNRATSDILGAGIVSAEEMLERPQQDRVQPDRADRPAPKAAPWITVEGRRKSFWAWAKNDLNLTEAQVHAALGVESLKDYNGTPAMARDTIHSWIDEQIELGQAKNEAAAESDPGERMVTQYARGVLGEAAGQQQALLDPEEMPFHGDRGGTPQSS